MLVAHAAVAESAAIGVPDELKGEALVCFVILRPGRAGSAELAQELQDLVATAFGHAGLDWKKHVVVDPKFIRPAEVDVLAGDASKARRVLGWEPKISFETMIAEMVDADLARLKKQRG